MIEKETEIRNIEARHQTTVRISNPLAAAQLMYDEENTIDKANDVDGLSNLNESTAKKPKTTFRVR